MLKKKHNYYDLLRYMELLEEGYSFSYIHLKYGINSSQLKCLWAKYCEIGKDALRPKKSAHIDGALKEEIVRDYLENHLTLIEAAIKYNVATTSVSLWVRICRSKGYAALYKGNYKEPAAKRMGRPKKRVPQTELEKLRLEVARLKAENDLLKKVKALVEARDARLHEIGRKPSEN